MQWSTLGIAEFEGHGFEFVGQDLVKIVGHGIEFVVLKLHSFHVQQISGTWSWGCAVILV
jgi:hypothetical protein